MIHQHKPNPSWEEAEERKACDFKSNYYCVYRWKYKLKRQVTEFQSGIKNANKDRNEIKLKRKKGKCLSHNYSYMSHTEDGKTVSALKDWILLKIGTKIIIATQNILNLHM